MEITGIRKIIGTKEMAEIRTVTLRMTIRKIAAIMSVTGTKNIRKETRAATQGKV